jgi:hypothetical protein
VAEEEVEVAEAEADAEEEGLPAGAVEGRALEGAGVEADGNDSIIRLWFPFP